MCPKCEEFAVWIRIGTPDAYNDLLRRLDDLVTAGVFRLVEGIGLKEILQAKQWPDDFILHVFECTNCGQRFRLGVDTWHGPGGSWDIIDQTEQ